MRVYLRAFEPGDFEKTGAWRRDPEIMEKTGGNVVFVSSEREREWVHEKAFPDEENLYLAICLSENDQMIGYLSVIHIDWRNRQAEWGGIIIGDKQLWGRGYGTEAAELMLRHVFFELGLHRFYGVWQEGHAGSLRMAEKLGFRKEGVLRDSLFKHNRFHGQVLMSLLKPEFEAVQRNEGA